MFRSGLVSRLFLGVAAFASVAMFTGCKASLEERGQKVTRHVSNRLDLNNEQKAEFKKLVDLAVADFKSLHDERKALGAEVEKQIVAEKADTTTIKKLMTEQSAKRQELMVKWVDQIAAFQAKLSPEQKQKALKMIQKFRDRFESHFED